MDKNKVMNLDIAKNRSMKKYSKKELFMRLLWMYIGSFAFRYSLRFFSKWRNFVLRLFGAKIGHHTIISNKAIIFYPWNLEIGNWSSIGDDALIYNLGKITIGNGSTISQRAHLCAGSHDYHLAEFPLLKLPISIGNEVWICADAFIGANVNIQDRAIAGARAVVLKDVLSNIIVGGNPAKEIKKRIMNNE